MQVRESLQTVGFRIMKRRSHGISLMEMLVVLVLVSMVSVLLMEAVSFVFGRYSQLQSHLDASGDRYLPDTWFRRSIGGLVAVPDRMDAFAGSEDSFEGHSLSPLSARDGTYTKISWYLVPEERYIALYARENEGQALRVQRWDALTARFSYLNTEDTFQQTWTGVVEGDSKPRLPRAIKLTIELDDRQRLEILAAVQLKLRASADYRDLL